MGPGAFAALAEALDGLCSVRRPALPEAVLAEQRGIDRVAAALLETAPAPAHWVGWSLGGLACLAAARLQPEAVARVTLLASAPRMVAGPGWPGIDAGELAAFRAALAADPGAAHARFLALQARGCTRGRATLRALRHATAADGRGAGAALEAGLALLAETDLRAGIAELSCPLDAVLGARDALLPVAVAGPLRALGARVHVLPGAAHAPMVSHAERVAAQLLE